MTHILNSSGERLAALRAELKREKLAGFLVPHADEHQNEYLPARAERLAWLTGFTGSAGAAVVLHSDAAIFVDGRYTLQVRQQVSGSDFEFCHITDHPPRKWIADHAQPGTPLGYDPWLHTRGQVDALRKALAEKGIELVAAEKNPIDEVWVDQPSAPEAPVVPHELAFAGIPSTDKRTSIAAELVERDVAAVILTNPDSIAWLLNIRGGDVLRTPLPLSFAILRADASVELFMAPAKATAGLERHLGNQVSIAPPTALGERLDSLGEAKVLADPSHAADWLFERLARAGSQVVKGEDPCIAKKARKNEVELNGTRAAHRRDGAALTGFLAWLDAEAPAGAVTEIVAETKLAELRGTGEHFKDLSFDTISGAGPNGAIVHYRVSEQSNRLLEPGTLYLVDSGAQYLDGTTDVTRTIAIGAPSDEMRDRFTRVLKGHIAIAIARFPVGTTGGQLDPMARQFLWQAGLDYDHGTGHGVGSYLGVHEGPQRISKRGGDVALEPGMIVSNEPGYYKEGAYGIRIENLVVVTAVDAPDGAEKELLGFETLTLAPIDTRLVDLGLMTTSEIDWLNGYHARVRDSVAPLVDADTRSWLETATQPIG